MDWAPEDPEATYAPAIPNVEQRNDAGAAWVGREAARTPVRFHDRVMAVFRSPDNLAYLRQLFATQVPAGPLRRFALESLHDAVYTFSEYEGQGYDVLASDPVAQRGALRPAVGLWEEIKRLNRVFYENRMAMIREQAHHIERRVPRDAIADDDEQYHMRMFISDSLRPPGLEHLNSAGPLYALREDQSETYPLQRGVTGRDGGGRRLVNSRTGAVLGTPPGPYRFREDFTAGPIRQPRQPRLEPTDDPDAFMYDEADAPWSRGNPNRTPSQAMAEYYGDDRVESETMTGGAGLMGQAYGDASSWGNRWEENLGTRFMRYPEINFWQKGGRAGYDREIEETLGLGSRELDSHVRNFDMSRVRDKRGQEYRRYGPRTSGAP